MRRKVNKVQWNGMRKSENKKKLFRGVCMACWCINASRVCREHRALLTYPKSQQCIHESRPISFCRRWVPLLLLLIFIFFLLSLCLSLARPLTLPSLSGSHGQTIYPQPPRRHTCCTNNALDCNLKSYCTSFPQCLLLSHSLSRRQHSAYACCVLLMSLVPDHPVTCKHTGARVGVVYTETSRTHRKFQSYSVCKKKIQIKIIN